MELLGDLFYDLIRAVGNQGQARDIGIEGFVDAQAFNIITATAKEAGYPGKHPWFILQQN
jgi:hypothetical protein